MKEDPEQKLLDVIIPGHIDNNDYDKDEVESHSTSVETLAGKVTLQAEDLGGGLTLLPHYIFNRPSA